ncbi:hypothetical protein, partial [Rhizobium sp. Leaf453]|uniref:hypothetical protein n=1 Tax=Rhizobium sp. Leaf453 TaxID=1736380 RepID=UPI000AE2E5F8
ICSSMRWRDGPTIRQQKTDGQTKQVGGQNWTPVTPPEGSIFHAETHNSVQQEMKRKPNSNMHSVYTLASEEFRRNWEQPEFRSAKVGGKAAFSSIAKAVQDEFSVNLTETRVIDEMTFADVPVAVWDIFHSFEKFFRD